MPSLRDLRKRLKSINSTGEMAKAMRTVATVKYARVSKTRETFTEFSSTCSDVLSLLRDHELFTAPEDAKSRNCLVFLSTNRGFCGGFNAECAKKFESELSQEEEAPLIIACGKKAESYCSSRKLEFEAFPLSDVPVFEDARKLSERISGLYTSGEVGKVLIITQKFENMLNQHPEKFQILPYPHPGGETSESEILFLPDEKAVGDSLAMYCLSNRVYAIMLDNASGAQAATVVAMRSACDNAEASSVKLELMINRRRQAEVTNSVIETSSSASVQGE